MRLNVVSDRPPLADAIALPRSAPPFRVGWMSLVAALASAAVVLFLRQDPYANPDSHAFDAIARSLIAGHGLVYHEPMYPSVPLYAFRSPGYSAFLALAFLLGGVTAAVALQGALQGVAAALLGDLARQRAGNSAGWIAFALRLAWPAGWHYAGQLLSESLFEFTLILTVWLAVRAGRHRSLRWAIAAGAMATFAMLGRPTGLGPALAILVWLGIRFPRGAVAFAVSGVLLWAPWPIRNYAHLHAFVPFQTMAGVALYDTYSGNPPVVAWTFMADHPDLGETGFERHFAREAAGLVRSDPEGFVRRVARASLDYVGPILDRRRDTWLHRFALLALLPALAWPGGRRRIVLPLGLWLAFGAFIVPIAMSPRYRFPIEWCVVLGASLGLVALSERWGWRRTAALACIGLACCVAFTLAIGRP